VHEVGCEDAAGLRGQELQGAEQAAHEQVDDREDYAAMISNLAGRRGEIE
jgi:hypothetical protein